ncbi:PAS domain-containing sensor histidine kinase [Parvularcula dongshanensis]|uniref:histidine kinase n=1 Tax=Parvularcula dongshanensis TaxID=1173995 RepID=A0A840I5K6_9PROT|nr:HWE histidine kinase domain-containing protein [Parvularcula dongshanensis]MBB4660139.1 two-component sensor histidine kinase [Parvularcula dongshanensis]
MAERIGPADETEMTALFRTFDWSGTALGPVAEWPQSLLTAVDMMLASGHAMCLAWGPEKTFLYNDAYVPIMGARHPWAFGATFKEAWPEVWPEIEPLVDATFRGETSSFRDMPLLMTRNGYPEETWWSFSYSPVRDDQGDIAGLLNVTLETTGRVLAQRQRDAASDELRRSEAKWRTIFETLEQGFILGEFIRDETGKAVDWRYEEVNDSWYDLVGVKRGAAIGRTIREVFPGIEDVWIGGFAEVTEQEAPVRFTRPVGSLGRWYDGVVQSAGGDRFTAIFTEVTERVWQEKRKAALLALIDRLTNETTTEGIIAAVSTALSEALDADQIRHDAEGATVEPVAVDLRPATLDAQSVPAPLRRFVEDLRGGRTVVVCDCFDDERTQPEAAAFEVSVGRAFVGVPFLERGTLAGVLRVGSPRPRRWNEDEILFVRDVGHRGWLAMERLRVEEQQAVLNQELSHRVKNTLGMVQAIAMQTFGGKAESGAVDDFGSRLRALSSAHDILLTQNWSAGGVREVVEAVIASFEGADVRMSGPELAIGPRATMSLSLLVHELATNAVKYGSLGMTSGYVIISWQVREEGGAEVLDFVWKERGGPPAVEPVRRGFGSRIIAMGLSGSGSVERRFGEEGLTVEMSAPLAAVQSA